MEIEPISAPDSHDTYRVLPKTIDEYRLLRWAVRRRMESVGLGSMPLDIDSLRSLLDFLDYTPATTPVAFQVSGKMLTLYHDVLEEMSMRLDEQDLAITSGMLSKFSEEIQVRQTFGSLELTEEREYGIET